MNDSRLVISQIPTSQTAGDSYLKFQINQHSFGLIAMKQIQEAVVIPTQAVAAMPNMPQSIVGLINWRSRIIWAVDMPRLLNLVSQDSYVREYNIIIIRTETTSLGLIVKSIQGAIRVQLEAIESPHGQIASGLVPYLRGCVRQEQQMLLVLDAEAIAQSSILRSNSI